MTPRTIHIGASFAIVLVAYWSYALLAVPWIEPSPDRIVDRRTIIPPPSARYDFHHLFPPDSWQLRDPKVVNSNGQTLLLWEKYQNRNNGWVDLTPLTIIYMPDETVVDRQERLDHAVVMDVPEGANLRFDPPLDLNKAGLGRMRLIEGKLRGPVTIRSRGKRADHQDDLLVRTRDVNLSEQRITSESDVDFHWGPNSGSGRKMEIKLLPRLGPHDGNQEGPNIGGIEQFQLEHLERLHLEQLADEPASAPAAGGPKPPAASSPLGALSTQPAPIEITCRGPFRFHLVDQVATFRDQVDVKRIHPDGPCDQLSCELLSIFFTRPVPPPGAVATEKKGGPGFDLKPARIEAQGTPTTLNAPMERLQARAERLQCNVKDDQITQIYLEDTQEVFLKQDADEIHAPSLRYTPGPPDHLGQFQLLAAGPGWLKGEMPGQAQPAGLPAQAGQQLEAHWQQKLEARPQDQNEVISLHGGARLSFQALGQLDAQEIHFWMHEIPPSPSGRQAGGEGNRLPSLSGTGARGEGKRLPSPTGTGAGGEGGPLPAPPQTASRSKFQPDRLLAEGNVVCNSPQFSTKDVRQLDIWFANPPPAVPAAYMPSTAGGPFLAQGERGATGGGMPAPGSSLLPQGMPGTADAGRQSHLEISGGTLQARVLMQGERNGELTEATVIDNVKLRETQTAVPGDLPLLVTGQWLHATQPNSSQAKVSVKGEPAHMEGRGMSLTGPNIDIDRAANLLKMEGPGEMHQLLDHDLDGKPLSKPENVKIIWQKGMVFDGRKAHFQDQVHVTSSSRFLATGWLDVDFEKPISFSDTGQRQPPSSAERLVCGNGVFVENRTIDDAGQQASYDRMWFKNLDMNNKTGDFHGDGPGRVISVRHGDSQALALPGGPLAGRPAMIRPAGFGPQQRPADPNPLTCIDLTFLRSLAGNKQRNECKFQGQVDVACAPAQSWETTLDKHDPKLLGPKGFVLRCDSLQFDDLGPVSGSKGGNVELRALDNVVGEGTDPSGANEPGANEPPTNFTTRSARLSYSQAKDLLILDGDGRSDAEVFRQKGPGTPVSHFAAQHILYFLKLDKVEAVGVHSMQAPGTMLAPGRK